VVRVSYGLEKKGKKEIDFFCDFVYFCEND
jgi:hypothetical protein